MAAPSAVPAKPAAPSVSVPQKEVGFPMPPPSNLKSKIPEALVAPPPAPTPVPSERVIVPQRGTLAAGRWEAKPATIWVLVALGALLLLAWALLRVRRATVERRKKMEAMITVRRSPAPPSA